MDYVYVPFNFPWYLSSEYRRNLILGSLLIFTMCVITCSIRALEINRPEFKSKLYLLLILWSLELILISINRDDNVLLAGLLCWWIEIVWIKSLAWYCPFSRILINISSFLPQRHFYLWEYILDVYEGAPAFCSALLKYN